MHYDDLIRMKNVNTANNSEGLNTGKGLKTWIIEQKYTLIKNSKQTVVVQTDLQTCYICICRLPWFKHLTVITNLPWIRVSCFKHHIAITNLPWIWVAMIQASYCDYKPVMDTSIMFQASYCDYKPIMDMGRRGSSILLRLQTCHGYGSSMVQASYCNYKPVMDTGRDDPSILL